MVKWTAHAKAQLRNIHDYIAADPPLYARRVSEELLDKTVGLDQLPRKGHKIPELNDETVREVSFYSYRIIYEVKPNHVIQVLAVIHKRRHIEQEDLTKP
ncbi:type II toxin-antitoxin system RelE/ParE family toxin [Gilvimarinus xylanilyticus]|uniref:Type II toxin-antitoxin system RelE/ParE family toxin n=1 Tax=Gilvimarinus xylanilyticus TaxID=2944139 RepID=A0A9X2I6C0_9GAMM|nr:type II toxin-antitoxin system RelE/ParE family toxin [Gilvimarinus xylanilyticus]